MKRLFASTLFRRVVVGLVLTACTLLASPLSAAPALELSSSSQHNAALKTDLLGSAEIRQCFPRLLDPDVEVLASGTKEYNCIAHSMGIHDHWVNPETGGTDNPLEPMDKLYGQLGYSRLPDMDLTVCAGQEKVVLYATLNPDASINQVTHAAHQEADGQLHEQTGEVGPDPPSHSRKPPRSNLWSAGRGLRPAGIGEVGSGVQGGAAWLSPFFALRK